jgi:hypothetical protein
MKWNWGFRIMPLSYQLKTVYRHTLKRYDIAQNYGILPTVVQRLSQHNLQISNYRYIKKIRQMKLVDISVIFHYSNLRLSKQKGSWVVSIKQNVNFKFQPPSVFVFCFFFAKLASLKVSIPLKIYQRTILYGPTLTSENFACISEVWTSAILEWFKLWN